MENPLSTLAAPTRTHWIALLVAVTFFMENLDATVIDSLRLKPGVGEHVLNR